MRTALLIVDPQKDFCPGGALAVAGGDAIMAPLNRMLWHADDSRWPVLVSRDWHPARTSHFKEFGGPWPPHCVQGTPGAEFHDELGVADNGMADDDVIISKAMRADEDGYSPLCDNAFVPDGRTAVQWLRDEGITELYVGGLATDYCVKAGVLDALKLGLKVHVLTDCIGAVDVKPEDGQRALEEMVAAGAALTTADEVAGPEED